MCARRSTANELAQGKTPPTSAQRHPKRELGSSRENIRRRSAPGTRRPHLAAQRSRGRGACHNTLCDGPARVGVWRLREMWHRSDFGRVRDFGRSEWTTGPLNTHSPPKASARDRRSSLPAEKPTYPVHSMVRKAAPSGPSTWHGQLRRGERSCVPSQVREEPQREPHVQGDCRQNRHNDESPTMRRTRTRMSTTGAGRW